jgi:hypothetical protein
MRAVRGALVLAFAVLLHAPLALAGPTDPATPLVLNDALGPTQSPGARRPEALSPPYVEHEFMVTGTAQIFTFEETPRRGFPIPGSTPAFPNGSESYVTRILTRVPADLSQFNGTVVIEWFNSTVGFDTAPVWDTSAEYFAREGIAYVGVTNSTTSIDFMKAGCVPPIPGLPPTCGTRYAALRFAENGSAYDMLSQIATLLRDVGHDNPLPFGNRVRRIYHAGQSQQGGSVVTYASNFHFPGNDGYFIQAATNARPINSQPACGAPNAPAYPACTPRLQGAQSLVATNVPVPVVQAITETDLAALFGPGGRQSNTPTFRYYELAGASHNPVFKGLSFFNLPLDITTFCALPFNTTADGPVFASFLINAMWDNLEQQVQSGVAPPTAPFVELQADGLTIARDDLGNARGGLRLPIMDVPLGTYGPVNQVAPGLPDVLQGQAGLFCRLSGTVTPLDLATLVNLYGNRETFEQRFRAASTALQGRRFLLPEDAQRDFDAAGIPAATPAP